MRCALVLSTFAAALAFSGPAWGGDRPGSSTGRRLRVLTYNVHVGYGADGRRDLRRIARIIRHAAPDVVALQEIDRRVKRSGRVDQVRALSRLTGMRGLFTTTVHLGGGRYGIAVLTRLPVVRSTAHVLPGPGEPRKLLQVELALDPAWEEGDPLSEEDRLTVLATHFSSRSGKARQRSVEAIEREILPTLRPGLVVLAGDLNAAPDSETLARLQRSFVLPSANGPRLTFPARRPSRQIDYIMVRPDARWRPTGSRVVVAPRASDHRPLLLELGERLPPEPSAAGEPQEPDADVETPPPT